MSNKFLLACCIVVLCVGTLAFADIWHIRANEYFGDGTFIGVNVDGDFHGLIFAWGIYAFAGGEDGCRIIPLHSPVVDAVQAACWIDYNKKATRFKGMYEFRGHPRPICGAQIGKEFPDKCGLTE